jgi:hypothetical protein
VLEVTEIVVPATAPHKSLDTFGQSDELLLVFTSRPHETYDHTFLTTLGTVLFGGGGHGKHITHQMHLTECYII